MKYSHLSAAPARRTIEKKVDRSEINRKNRLAYLAKHPAAKIPFRTVKIQKPVVDEMLNLKRDDESWGEFLTRVLRKAGFKITVKI